MNKKQNDNLKHHSLKVFLLLIFSFAILIILIQSISAVQVEMKEEFSQGETLTAKISGNFVDAVGTSNLFFYREHVRIPTQFTLSKLGNDYYVYALLSGKISGNYSLQLQDVKYKVATEVKEDNIIKNFTITDETADFYVVPGFIKTSDDFFLELTNLRDSKIEVEIVSENSSSEEEGFFASLFGAGSNTQTIELFSGQESKKVSFNFDDSLNKSTLKEIKLESENTSYSIPVYMEINETKKTEGIGKLTFEQSVLNISLATNSNTTRVIYLNNKENLSVKNISLYVSESLEPYINLSVTELDELDKNSSIKIELRISSPEDEDNLEGQITAKYAGASGEEDLFVYSTILLSFIEDYIPQYEDNTTIINTKTCSELNGTICDITNETCSGESVYAKDNKCCLSVCSLVEKSSTGKIVGWSLVAVVVIFVAWFLIKRYKKVSNPIDLLKVAKGRR